MLSHSVYFLVQKCTITQLAILSIQRVIKHLKLLNNSVHSSLKTPVTTLINWHNVVMKEIWLKERTISIELDKLNLPAHKSDWLCCIWMARRTKNMLRDLHSSLCKFKIEKIHLSRSWTLILKMWVPALRWNPKSSQNYLIIQLTRNRYQAMRWSSKTSCKNAHSALDLLQSRLQRRSQYRLEALTIQFREWGLHSRRKNIRKN